MYESYKPQSDPCRTDLQVHRVDADSQEDIWYLTRAGDGRQRERFAMTDVVADDGPGPSAEIGELEHVQLSRGIRVRQFQTRLHEATCLDAGEAQGKARSSYAMGDSTTHPCTSRESFRAT